MAVPDFQSLMLPLLNIAADGEEHSLIGLREAIGNGLNLSDEDRKELLPSGRQGKFANRVAWASVYLRRAGLLESPSRGRVRIAARGHAVLKSSPARIDIKFLMEFPEFAAFRGEPVPEPDDGGKGRVAQTPQERLESSYQELRRELATELRQRIMRCPPAFFEKLVVDLLVAMGYGGSRQDAGQAVGRTGDGGVDGIIKEDKLGLDVVYVQAKRWEGTVGRPDVQAFAGSLEGHRA
ncbi:MAG: winged helix-turn-helix domain-containing protein, partial [Acidobacteriota bacterium]